ncbi:MAG TPA: hypothetical protein VD766_09490 [Solirubrobacterales bacterium]|nr:hypothetical protein [Solirubrobacterales bacterium]
MLGTLNIIYGIGALDDANFAISNTRFVLDDLNTLGWVLIIVGVLELTGGFSLMGGGGYGKFLGILAGTLGAVSAFFSIAGENPWWSILMFILCIWIVHGLIMFGEDEAYVEGPRA